MENVIPRAWLVTQKAELIADAVSVLEVVTGAAAGLPPTDSTSPDALIQRIRAIADALEAQNKPI